ncbi:MAG: helix-turn-helix transcriptional regulator [bacterium]
MSSQPQSNRQTLDENPLGKWLRALRHARGLPLRAVAAAAEMDTALLSKIELGQRLPTETQATLLASFFTVSAEEMEARRIADKFWHEHRDTPAAHRAINLIKEKADARADRTNG